MAGWIVVVPNPITMYRLIIFDCRYNFCVFIVDWWTKPEKLD